MKYYDEEEGKLPPAPKLRTDRRMWKLMLFSILTLGIYGIVFFLPFSYDLDRVAPKKDHTKTMNYLFALLLSFVTLSIVMSVWYIMVAWHASQKVRAGLVEIQYRPSAIFSSSALRFMNVG